MILCIPTLNRYDLLERCINSALSGYVKPDIFIIDNGGDIPNYFYEFPNTKVFSPGENLGVAGSWNYFLRNCEYPKLIINDDLEFSYYDIYNFMDAYKREEAEFYYANNIDALNMFSCFMPTKSVVDSIGNFDERFYPAYFEDNDYAYRMYLAEVKVQTVPTSMYHHGSSTIKSYSEERKQQHHKEFNANREYYIQKWGGLPHKEVYTRPFG